jgi:hypothetical protein
MPIVVARSSQDYVAFGLFGGVTRLLLGELRLPAPLGRETKIGFSPCSMQVRAERGI